MPQQGPAAAAPIAWRDTPLRYGLVTRLLHWGMALLMLWQFTGMGLRLALGRTPLVSFFVGSHAPVGTLLLLLALVRLGWGISSRRHRPPHEAGPVGRAAQLGHAALYLLMAVVPALALLRLYGSGRGFAPFGIPLFAPRETRIEWMMAPANMLHSTLAWTLLALIAGHIAMALLHQLYWRDGLLLRMAGRARRSG